MAPTDSMEKLSIGEKPKTGPGGKPIVNLAVTGEWADASSGYAGPKISDRALATAVDYHAEGLDHILRIMYDPESNPDGVINLGLAENTMLTKDYLEYYAKVFPKALKPLDMVYGNQSSASRRFHQAVADMWNENFSPLEPVHRDQISTAPGATGALDQLFHALANPGDAILIAAPHYNGFDVNMVARSGAKIVNVDSPGPDAAFETEGAEIAAFEKKLEECKVKGINVRAVMLCNPQNPWGRTYDKKVLCDYALFAEKHDLHLISDEIYAFSVFDNPKLPKAAPFISMLSLDVAKETGKPFNPSRLHIVYSFSKDFGCNGFRLGVIISQHNPFVLRALLHNVFLSKLSSPADALMSYLLNDKPTFKTMVSKNRELLKSHSEKLAAWCEQRGWKPVPVNSTHFMMVDAAEALGLKTFDEEREFARSCVPFGVVVGAGMAYHAAQPGWLRLTFSLDPQTLKLGLDRLDQAIEAWKAGAKN